MGGRAAGEHARRKPRRGVPPWHDARAGSHAPASRHLSQPGRRRRGRARCRRRGAQPDRLDHLAKVGDTDDHRTPPTHTSSSRSTCGSRVFLPRCATVRRASRTPTASGCSSSKGCHRARWAVPSQEGASGMRPGGFDPDIRVKDLDADGVWGEVLYPTIGLFGFMIPDPELRLACAQVYNTGWPRRSRDVAPFRRARRSSRSRTSTWPSRSGARRDPRPSVGDAADARARRISPTTSRCYDPLWAAAQAHDMPVSFHVGTGTNPVTRTRTRAARSSTTSRLGSARNARSRTSPRQGCCSGSRRCTS